MKFRNRPTVRQTLVDVLESYPGPSAADSSRGSRQTFESYAVTYGLAREDGTLPHPLTTEGARAIASETHSRQAEVKSFDAKESRGEAGRSALESYEKEYRQAAEMFKPAGQMENELPAPGTPEADAYMNRLFEVFCLVPGSDGVDSMRRAMEQYYLHYEAQLKAWQSEGGKAGYSDKA
jgi:hypothetical protein